MKKVPKYQTATVTVPNGSTTATIVEADVVLDQQYQRVTGVAAYLVSASHSLRMGITTSAGTTIQDLTHLNDYIPDIAVEQGKRYKALSLPARGNQIKLTFRPFATLAADQTVDVVFVLENDEQ